MELTDFTKDSPGKLEPIRSSEPVFQEDEWEARDVDTHAFSPEPLPANIDANAIMLDLYHEVIAAERSLSQLEGAASRLTNPHLLIGAFSRREAIASSAIENTFATPEELALFNFVTEQTSDRNQVNEVNNYVRVLEYGLQSELPVSRRLILEMHAVLFDGVQRAGINPGAFRASQNFIGKTPRISEATFVPPPPHQVESCIADLERFANHADPLLPRLIRLGMIHYQFETIHPFGDGNGRIGRILIVLMLCKHAQLSKPLVYVSGYFEQNRQQYYDLLYQVSARGAWRDWLAFFLQAVHTQAVDAIQRADKLVDLQSRYHEIVREKRASAQLPALIDYLFERPAITHKAVQQILSCAPQTAINLVNKLLEKRILVELQDYNHPKQFYAPAIIDVVYN